MNKIKKIDNLEIFDYGNKILCRKKTNTNNLKKYKYLKSKDFNNIIVPNIINGYEVREYIKEVSITNEDKLNQLVYLISLLHTKTTHYKNISINDIKEFYEKITDEIIETKKYYNEIIENNDVYYFMKPSIEIIINKASLFLVALDNSKFFLDKWYEIIKNKSRKRVVMNHNNLKITNFIVSEQSYLINFDQSIIDYPIFDLISLFKNNYKIIDMIDLFEVYNSKYPLLLEEKFLLFSLLLKIEIINLDNCEIINTRNICNIIMYLDKISVFLQDCMKTKK